jgi:hypothetical protein
LLGALVAGAFLGALGAVIVAARVVVRGVTVPWGLVLMLVAVGVIARGAAWMLGSRRGAAAVGLGWIIPTVLLASTGRGGDVLMPDVPRTYVYLIGGLVLVLLAALLPLPVDDEVSADPDPEPDPDAPPAAPVHPFE